MSGRLLVPQSCPELIGMKSDVADSFLKVASSFPLLGLRNSISELIRDINESWSVYSESEMEMR